MDQLIFSEQDPYHDNLIFINGCTSIHIMCLYFVLTFCIFFFLFKAFIYIGFAQLLQ